MAVVVDSMLGEGGFARIYRARDAGSGAVYALKHIRIPPGSDMLEDIQHEVRPYSRTYNKPNEGM